MKFNPKTALITLPISLARAGRSSSSTGSFKTEQPTSTELEPNLMNIEFYTEMEETGKLKMYLKVEVEAVKYTQSQANPRICVAFREVGAAADADWDIAQMSSINEYW